MPARHDRPLRRAATTTKAHRRTTGTLWLLVTVATLATPRDAQADDAIRPRVTPGSTYVHLATGLGRTSIQGATRDADVGGLGLALRGALGVVIRDGFSAGGELMLAADAGTVGERDPHVSGGTVSGSSAFVSVRPWPTLGLRLEAGVGWRTYSQTFRDPMDEDNRRIAWSGYGWTAGGAWTVWTSSRWSVGLATRIDAGSVTGHDPAPGTTLSEANPTLSPSTFSASFVAVYD